MTFDEAKEVLKEYIQPNGGLYCLGHYLKWSPGDNDICLDCRFKQKELEAIVVYMRDYSTNNLNNDPDSNQKLTNENGVL